MVTQLLFELALEWAARVNSLQRAPEQISSPCPKWHWVPPMYKAHRSSDMTYNSKVKTYFPAYLNIIIFIQEI